MALAEPQYPSHESESEGEDREEPFEAWGLLNMSKGVDRDGLDRRIGGIAIAHDGTKQEAHQDLLLDVSEEAVGVEMRWAATFSSVAIVGSDEGCSKLLSEGRDDDVSVNLRASDGGADLPESNTCRRAFKGFLDLSEVVLERRVPRVLLIHEGRQGKGLLEEDQGAGRGEGRKGRGGDGPAIHVWPMYGEGLLPYARRRQGDDR